MGYMMNLYTPMTSANTTPATTPGSTPPSGADAYEQEGGKSNGVVSRLRSLLSTGSREAQAGGRGDGHA